MPTTSIASPVLAKQILFVGGFAAFVTRALAPKLLTDFGIEVSHHWEWTNRPGRFPKGVDLVICCTEMCGHIHTDAALAGARKFDVPFVMAPRKWSFMRKQLEDAGLKLLADGVEVQLSGDKPKPVDPGWNLKSEKGWTLWRDGEGYWATVPEEPIKPTGPFPSETGVRQWVRKFGLQVLHKARKAREQDEAKATKPAAKVQLVRPEPQPDPPPPEVEELPAEPEATLPGIWGRDGAGAVLGTSGYTVAEAARALRPERKRRTPEHNKTTYWWADEAAMREWWAKARAKLDKPITLVKGKRAKRKPKPRVNPDWPPEPKVSVAPVYGLREAGIILEVAISTVHRAAKLLTPEKRLRPEVGEDHRPVYYWASEGALRTWWAETRKGKKRRKTGRKAKPPPRPALPDSPRIYGIENAAGVLGETWAKVRYRIRELTRVKHALVPKRGVSPVTKKPNVVFWENEQHLSQWWEKVLVLGTLRGEVAEPEAEAEPEPPEPAPPPPAPAYTVSPVAPPVVAPEPTSYPGASVFPLNLYSYEIRERLAALREGLDTPAVRAFYGAAPTVEAIAERALLLGLAALEGGDAR